MNRLSAKLGLCAIVWCELMAEVGLGAGSAFVLILLLTFLSSIALQAIGLSMQIAGPSVVSVTLHGLVWFILFWWMAPAGLWNLPWIADIAVLGLVGLMGARCRQDLSRHGARQALWQHKRRSPVIIILVITGTATGMLALHFWGSLWPLIGWALLLVIPFRVGWQWAPPLNPERADAKMGNRATFEEAGWSAER